MERDGNNTTAAVSLGSQSAMAHHMLLLLSFITICTASCSAFINGGGGDKVVSIKRYHRTRNPSHHSKPNLSDPCYFATRDQDASLTTPTPTTTSEKNKQLQQRDDTTSAPSAAALSIEINLKAYASSGIHETELSHILEIIASVCHDEYGLPIDIDIDDIQIIPSIIDSIPGVLGRVLLINVCGVPSINFDVEENELISQLKIDLCERIDIELQSNNIKQPILLAFQAYSYDTSDNNTIANDAIDVINGAIEKEISDYDLREAVNDECQIIDDDISVDSLLSADDSFECFIHPYEFEINCFPSSVIEIDGDMIVSSSSTDNSINTYDEDNTEQEEMQFDTSSVLLFDKLINKSLRKRLLNVVKGYPEDHVTDEDDDWNDIECGPDPSRWIRGGLTDVVSSSNDGEDGDTNEGSCWGLTDEAIMDICNNYHPAIAEFESKLSILFPDYIVSRLPESVLGDCVSSLTANAPTHEDTFDYHIDADPLQVPPSPWADVFGRYPNRRKGKPRFVR